MKFYRVQTGPDSYRWFNLKEDAEREARKLAKLHGWPEDVKALNVPTDKKGLLHFLNTGEV